MNPSSLDLLTDTFSMWLMLTLIHRMPRIAVKKPEYNGIVRSLQPLQPLLGFPWFVFSTVGPPLNPRIWSRSGGKVGQLGNGATAFGEKLVGLPTEKL
jgi:hypothetical protein